MSPIAPDSSTLVDDFPTSPATIDRAKTNSEKNSQGPNVSQRGEGPGEFDQEKATECAADEGRPTPTQTDRPASPFFVIGKPSKVVATAEGVPGKPIRLAVIEPPAEPPT